MLFKAFSQREEPIPLLLHGTEVDFDDMDGWMSLVQESSSLVVDVVILLLAELHLMKQLKTRGFLRILPYFPSFSLV